MLQLSFVNFNPNSYILVEGAPVKDHFFIIQSGTVNCFHSVPIPGSVPTTLGPGDFVGVIPCMSGHSQTENVVAKTPVVAIMVKKDQYPELIMKNTPVAMKIVRAFANSMRQLNDNLTKLTTNKISVESSEQLFTIADYYHTAGFNDIAVYGYYQYMKQCPGGVNIQKAKQRFIALKQNSKAVYFEPSQDLLRNYPAGTMIFSEFQTGADMFIIQEGSVKITKVVDGKEVTLALLKKGDMFGEMALLENKPRSASAIAQDGCKLMTVNHANFDQMVTSQPVMISKLTTMLAERLWSMYRQLSNTQLNGVHERITDMLALQIEKKKVVPVRGQPYETGLTMKDIISLCSFDLKQQSEAMNVIYNDPNMKLENNKITIPDVEELIKQADFYRKQYNKRSNNEQQN